MTSFWLTKRFRQQDGCIAYCPGGIQVACSCDIGYIGCGSFGSFPCVSAFQLRAVCEDVADLD